MKHRLIAAAGLALLTTCLALIGTRMASGEPAGLAGTIISLVDGAPIAAAQVQVGILATTTDAQGRYHLPLASGTYQVRVAAEGAIGMTITRQEVAGLATLDVAMVPAHPTAEQRELLDAKLRELAQEITQEEALAAQERGFGLSGVTTVPATIRVLMPDGTVVVMTMDEYLKGVVPHEVPPYWHTESLRAQALAARSYAATRHAHGDADVCTTVHCQVWSARHYDTTDLAVDETHGQAATYGGNIINAFFFGHCDGHTRNSEDVWGGYLPYCRSVSCPCGFDTMWGHGVGMCQEGARVLAEQGTDYVTILQHYYSGVQVSGPPPGRVTSASVFPLSGDGRTEFSYQATYHSTLSDPPAAAHVIIDGQGHALTRVGGDADTGWLYGLTTKLVAGEHTLRFYFDDGYGAISTVPVQGEISGPSVVPGDPASPSPTPVADLLGDVQLDGDYASTVLDWSTGTRADLEIVATGDGALAVASGKSQGTYTSAMIAMPWQFTAIGAIWHTQMSADDALAVAVRTSLDGAVWTGWQPLIAVADGTPRHALSSSEPIYASGRYLQWRATLTRQGQSTCLLENMRVICMDASPGVGSGFSALVSEQPGPPRVISRAMWGAQETLMMWPPEYRTPVAVVLHQTVPVPASLDPVAVVRSHYVYDAVLREQGDISFNYLIDASGTIYEGRSGGECVVGSHAGRFDWGSIGITLIQNETGAFPSTQALQSLSRLLAWRCHDYAIDPLGEQLFIDVQLPTIVSRCDLALVPSAEDDLHSLLPQIRAMTVQEMANVTPQVAIVWPQEDEQVRDVVRLDLEASAVITQVDYYVDDVLRQTDGSLPGAWRWNTTLEQEGAHALRVVVRNAAGQSEDSVTVQVDNTPPTGSISAPDWNTGNAVPFMLDVQGAHSVQFSNGWQWEGEDLLHSAGTGVLVADAQALNGQAWLGRGGLDQPGGWFGPYTCGLLSWRNYDVVFRLKTSDNSSDLGLATLDVADDQGRRVYAQQPLSALDFSDSDVYRTFVLPLAYESQWPTCDDPNTDDGVEFRVWYSSAGDLAWDRVTVYREAQPLTSPFTWAVIDQEGQQPVSVRVLDQAGNALEQEMLVGIDRTAPQWSSFGAAYACAEDAASGIDPNQVYYALSQNGGASWSGWQRLVQGVDVHGPGSVCVQFPPVAGTHIRFQVRDMLGWISESQALPIPLETPQPTNTVTPTPTSTATATPGATRTATSTATPSARPTLPTPDPAQTPSVWLPLSLR